MNFFDWSVNYWSVFCTFSGTNISGTKKFSDHSFLYFFAPLNEMFQLEAKKSRYFEKKIFTDRKNDDITFWGISGVKILPPSIFLNFGTLKSD